MGTNIQLRWQARRKPPSGKEVETTFDKFHKLGGLRGKEKKLQIDPDELLKKGDLKNENRLVRKCYRKLRYLEARSISM